MEGHSCQNLILQASAQRDAQGILLLVREHGGSLGPVSVATALHRLAKALRTSTKECRHRSVAELRQPLLDMLPEFRAQALANSVWALATLPCEDSELVSGLCETASSQLASLHGRHLSNFAWALATLKTSSEELLAGLSAEILRRAEASGLSPQSLANISWSYATLCEWNAEVFDGLGRSSLAAAWEFQARDLANVLWAFTGHPGRGGAHGPLLLAMSAVARHHSASLPPQDLTSIAWAFAQGLDSGHPLRRAPQQGYGSAGAGDFERVE